MAISKAKTPAAYLAELPADRRNTIARVRDVVRKNLPKGYKETMNWGMIAYEIPMEEGEKTYNGQPICYVGLAAQKNYNSLYLTGPYSDPRQAADLEKAYAKAGRRLDMGQTCLRFRSLDELPLDVIGKMVASTPPAKLRALYAKWRSAPSRKPATKTTRKKRAAAKRSTAARKR